MFDGNNNSRSSHLQRLKDSPEAAVVALLGRTIPCDEGKSALSVSKFLEQLKTELSTILINDRINTNVMDALAHLDVIYEHMLRIRASYIGDENLLEVHGSAIVVAPPRNNIVKPAIYYDTCSKNPSNRFVREKPADWPEANIDQEGLSKALERVSVSEYVIHPEWFTSLEHAKRLPKVIENLKKIYGNNASRLQGLVDLGSLYQETVGQAVENQNAQARLL